MKLTLPLIAFLKSPTAERTLASLAGQNLSETQTLTLLTQLRQHYSPEKAGILLAQARLRQIAASKFADNAAKMLFTEDALQQASDPLIRQYRAGLIDTTKPVFDMGCGIGSDSIAIAKAGTDVTGLDIDPVRVALARHNADIAGLEVTFKTADVRDYAVPDDATVFFDPARRDETGKRIFDVERYQPPLSLIKQWQNAGQIIVKLSPGVKLSQLENYSGAVEFISVNGALKEALLWQPSAFKGAKATLLTEDGMYHWQRKHVPETGMTTPRAWLIEPDPALIRAGLVQDVAVVFEGTLLDEQIAYFTTDTAPHSPWLRAWRILDWMPYNLKKLKAYLRSCHVGNVTVKKRGSPITPEELIARLKLKKGTESRTLVLTRHRDTPIVLICENIAA